MSDRHTAIAAQIEGGIIPLIYEFIKDTYLPAINQKSTAKALSFKIKRTHITLIDVKIYERQNLFKKELLAEIRFDLFRTNSLLVELFVHNYAMENLFLHLLQVYKGKLDSILAPLFPNKALEIGLNTHNDYKAYLELEMGIKRKLERFIPMMSYSLNPKKFKLLDFERTYPNFTSFGGFGKAIPSKISAVVVDGKTTVCVIEFDHLDSEKELTLKFSSNQTIHPHIMGDLKKPLNEFLDGLTELFHKRVYIQYYRL